MKQALLFLVFCMACSGVRAAGEPDNFTVVLANVINQTNVTTQTGVEGKIYSFVVDVTGTTTGALTVVSTKTGETLLNVTVTADKVYRPRVPVQTTLGADYAGTSNVLERFMLINDTLTYTLSETGPVTNQYKITTNLEK